MAGFELRMSGITNFATTTAQWQANIRINAHDQVD